MQPDSSAPPSYTADPSNAVDTTTTIGPLLRRLDLLRNLILLTYAVTFLTASGAITGAALLCVYGHDEVGTEALFTVLILVILGLLVYMALSWNTRIWRLRTICELKRRITRWKGDFGEGDEDRLKVFQDEVDDLSWSAFSLC